MSDAAPGPTEPLIRVDDQVMTDTMAVLSEGFTAHNIVLPDGSQTRPGTTVLAESELVKSAL